MAIFDISGSAVGFDMSSASAINPSGTKSGVASQFNWLSLAGNDIRLFSASNNFTYNGSGDPTGGTATSGDIDLGNNGGAPDVVFSGFSGGLVAMSGSAAGFYPVILAGDDTVTGSAFNDTLIGLGGADLLFGGNRHDSLLGGDGDDYVAPGNGRDDSDGGAGNDFLDLAPGGETDAIIDMGAGTVTFASHVETHLNYEQVQGTPGDDSVVGTSGSDIAAGHSGDDTISGDDGGDSISGGLGQDVLIGGKGFDFIFGSDGDDALKGGSVADTMLGGLDDDLIAGQGGRDSLVGGSGNDTIRGNIGFDQIDGDGGADVLAGRGGADTMNGGAGDDLLTGKGGNDVYEFEFGGGADTVRSFVEGPGVVDVVRLIGFGTAFDTFAEVMATATTDGVSTTFDFGADTLTIRGVAPSAFHSDDFQFI